MTIDRVGDCQIESEVVWAADDDESAATEQATYRVATPNDNGTWKVTEYGVQGRFVDDQGFCVPLGEATAVELVDRWSVYDNVTDVTDLESGELMVSNSEPYDKFSPTPGDKLDEAIRLADKYVGIESEYGRQERSSQLSDGSFQHPVS